MACTTLWDTLALLHSHVLQGKGREPAPDSAASKSPSPRNPQTPRKGLCRSQGFSSSSVGSSCAPARCSVSAVPAAAHSTAGSCLLLPTYPQTKGGLCASHNPCGCQESWQRGELPSGCSKTIRTYKADWAWMEAALSDVHCPVQELAFVSEGIKMSMMISS